MMRARDSGGEEMSLEARNWFSPRDCSASPVNNQPSKSGAANRGPMPSMLLKPEPDFTIGAPRFSLHDALYCREGKYIHHASDPALRPLSSPSPLPLQQGDFRCRLSPKQRYRPSVHVLERGGNATKRREAFMATWDQMQVRDIRPTAFIKI